MNIEAKPEVIDYIGKLKQENANLQKQVDEMQNWVNDLQSGMYINCVYCGHRYGPQDKTPSSMADVLKQHIEKCPKHPMSKLKIENDTLRKHIKESEDSNWELRNKLNIAMDAMDDSLHGEYTWGQQLNILHEALAKINKTGEAK